MSRATSQRAVAALLAVLLCGLAACRHSAPAPPNVLLVVIDTLRADRLGAYGSTRGLTPFLDQLAARSTVFRTTYAPSSWTNPSVASLLTSRYQSQHHVTSFTSVLGAGEVTLPEELRPRGYATGAFLANFMLRRTLGFDQGFDHYATFARTGSGTNKLLKARAERINREALAWLDTVRATPPAPPPVFLYVHYMEPHNPYDPPDDVLDRVLAGRPRPERAAVNRSMVGAYDLKFTAAMVRDVEMLYDAEVASLDASLRALFDGLQQRGFLDNAVVIVTADHGEEFYEHDLMGHHKSLFEPAIRVPLLIHLPEQTAGAVVDGYAELVDVAPTVLDLVGMSPAPSFSGRSLRSHLADPAAGLFAALRRRVAPPPPLPRQAFSELIKEADAPRKLLHERAVIIDSTKLLVSAAGQRTFYDLAADPGETNPQALDTSRRARLESGLDTLHAHAAQSGTTRGEVALDAQTKERMRLLGYVE